MPKTPTDAQRIERAMESIEHSIAVIVTSFAAITPKPLELVKGGIPKP